MAGTQKRDLSVEPVGSAVPEIGRWLWAMQDGRRRTLRDVQGLPDEAVDWAPADGGSSIGSVLYHIAVVEADWLYEEVLVEPFSPEVEQLLAAGMRNEDGRLVDMAGKTLADHLEMLAYVRGLLLDVYGAMDLADFRRARVLPEYDVTPEWVLHHLLQHEAEHRSQLGALRVGAGSVV